MPTSILHPPPVDCAHSGNHTPRPAGTDADETGASGAEDHLCCQRCGRDAEDSETTVDGGSVCADCAAAYYEQCAHCERLADLVHTTADGEEVCAGCALDHYWECESCCALIDCGDYCEPCETELAHHHGGGLVRDYGYKPRPCFYGDGPLFLGFELEINTPWRELDGCAEIAMMHLGEELGELGYLKEDTSIDYGFEIVTHPMSYPWAMAQFPWQMLTDLAAEGCHGHGTGLHVHISRDAFTGPGHVYRWMKLLHRNRDQVITLARRESDWAAFTDSDRRNVKHYAKGAHSGRYRAINTQNAATFELRIFASSLDHQHVQAALGLAAASVAYTRALTVTDIATAGAWQWSAFTAWVSEHPEYTPLTRELGRLACAC